MTQNQTMPVEVLNKLIETFQTRMANFGIKKGSKKYLDAQQEFFAGACTSIDTVFENSTASCIPPAVFISLLRGSVLEKL